MAQMNLDDLRRLMNECAGVDESVDLSADIGDSPFEELGYDSLAVLEITARIEQEFGVRVPEEESLTTPAALIEYVNNGGVMA
jgi:minimal PKS acyl carrier protein